MSFSFLQHQWDLDKWISDCFAPTFSFLSPTTSFRTYSRDTCTSWAFLNFRGEAIDPKVSGYLIVFWMTPGTGWVEDRALAGSGKIVLNIYGFFSSYTLLLGTFIHTLGLKYRLYAYDLQDSTSCYASLLSKDWNMHQSTISTTTCHSGLFPPKIWSIFHPTLMKKPCLPVPHPP